MTRQEQFRQAINHEYNFKGDTLLLGTAILDGEALVETPVKLPLKTINRHGLIAGATGTGKTKTLQVISEGLSEHGIPVLLMDIKGDLSGLAAIGTSHPFIIERHEKIGIPYRPKSFPVEFLTISNEGGVRMRATVSEFGPVLLSKILELNDTQSGLMAILFKYCDDNLLPLLDLKDLRKVLQFMGNEGKDEIQKEYGLISTTTVSTILRKVIELEQQGAGMFFGEQSFEVEDFLRKDDDGLGYISIFKITDIQDRPKLFSTFMLSLLAEIYSTFPETGDIDKPKLVIFIDEAHLIFDNASKALLQQIESIIKLIRSKGVGIFFCTQNPSDIPQSILGQLGLKIQHALRAFTANDRKMIKMTAENYPFSGYYKTDELLTSLGIGEAAITVLNEKGVPSPLVATLLQAPKSRMGILTNEETTMLVSISEIATKYNKVIDRESAFEILEKKLRIVSESTLSGSASKTSTPNKTVKKEKSTLEEIMNSPVTRQVGQTIFRELTRGLLGALGVSGRGGSRKRY